MSGRSPRRGDIWYANTPGQPDDPHQPRPVLIISEDIRNSHSDDVIVVPLFSDGRLGPTRVVISAGMGGIRHESVAFCEEVTTLDHDFLYEGPLGRPVPRAALEKVVDAVYFAVGGEA